jgi:hypothetical protein
MTDGIAAYISEQREKLGEWLRAEAELVEEEID